ncbi:MAG TPA: UbiA family prenyltransferase [Candidatus Thermoplasmatota archaeon]|nr:UbiA family prenyltransferase [Candidatus Thermoplasmatota archaeon]
MAYPVARPVARAPVVAAARLLRPGNALITAAAVATGAYVAAGTPALHAWPVVLAAAFAAFACAAAGNVLNDVRDVGIDRLAHPDRPLVRGDLSPKTAGVLVWVLFALALAAAAYAWVTALLITLLAIGLLLWYEFQLKAEGLPGNLVVALLTGLPFLLGAAVLGHPFSPAAWTLALLAAAATLGRELVKDVQDHAADEGRHTFPRRYGVRRGRQAAAAAFLLAVAASPLVLLVPEGFGLLYLALVVPADALFVYAAFTPDPARASAAAKGAMVVGLAAFVGGRWAA